MTSVIGIAVGVVLLVVSLAARNNYMVVASITSWVGAILVIVGTGKLVFLDK